MVLTVVGKAKVVTDINTAFTHVAIGTGTTPAAKAHTTLESEAMRVASTNTAETTTDAGDSAQQSATFNIIAASLAVTNSGVFTAASSGTMLCEQVFSAINVVSGDTLTVVWKEVVS